jgi:hypothetical protein
MGGKEKWRGYWGVKRIKVCYLCMYGDNIKKLKKIFFKGKEIKGI